METREQTRQRIIEMVNKLRENTVSRGCTLGEAQKFAAKAAELIEKYQIQEAELTGRAPTADEIEVCQNKLRTGMKVFNPGMTAVVNALAIGRSAKCILLYEDGKAVYGIVGEQMDADYVCHISLAVVPALKEWARMEGIQHGEEKAGLIRWSNQYLIGAGEAILSRLVQERKQRSDAKKAQSTGLICITGDMLAKVKTEAVAQAFDDLYPNTRQKWSKSAYNSEARERGREAGNRIGLNVGIEGGNPLGLN